MRRYQPARRQRPYLINLPGGAATPTFSPAGGTYGSAQAVTISDTTAGATIHYTTDGSNPNATSPLYSGPLRCRHRNAEGDCLCQRLQQQRDCLGALHDYSAGFRVPERRDEPVDRDGRVAFERRCTVGWEPAGDTMAVNASGNLIATNTYGNGVVMFTPGSTTPTVLGSISNPNGVAVDSQNNLYIGLSYTSQVVKLPFVNGAYPTLAGTSGTTPTAPATIRWSV